MLKGMGSLRPGQRIEPSKAAEEMIKDIKTRDSRKIDPPKT